MKTVIVLLAALAIAPGALAGGRAEPTGLDFGTTNTASAAAASSAQAAAFAAQGQVQGQSLSTSQSSLQRSAQANQQGVTINEAAQDYHDMYEDYTAAAYAPPMPVSNCEDGKSIGLVIPTVGSVSLGGSSNNENCERLEQVRIGIATGDQDSKALANAVLQLMLEKSYAEIEAEESETRPVTRPRSEPTASTGYDWDALGG